MSSEPGRCRARGTEERGGAAMVQRRLVEVFTAGCGICAEVLARVQELACPSCKVLEVETGSPLGEQRARALGVASVPAVAIDGVLVSCCAGRGVDEAALRAAGLGEPR